MKIYNAALRPIGKRQISIVILFSLIVFFMVGCDAIQKRISKIENSNQSTQVSEDVTKTSKEPHNGICENKYYPIDPDVKREFKMSTKTDSNYSTSQEKSAENLFVETRTFDSGLKMVTNWQCMDDGLRNAEFDNKAVSSQMKFDMETIESSGITLPKIWEKGKTWTTEYKISAKLNVAKIAAAVNGTVTISNEITAMDDKIVVPGGEFTAARIDSELILNLSMKGRKLPTSKFTMSNWYAPNVGLVKQVAKTPYGDETVEFIGNK